MDIYRWEQEFWISLCTQGIVGKTSSELFLVFVFPIQLAAHIRRDAFKINISVATKQGSARSSFSFFYEACSQRSASRFPTYVCCLCICWTCAECLALYVTVGINAIPVDTRLLQTWRLKRAKPVLTRRSRYAAKTSRVGGHGRPTM